MSRTYLLLPAYNEEASLEKLLPKALAVKPALSIVVVDDGSSDGTAALVESLAQDHPRLELLRHPKNMGLGQATRTLLRHALDTADDQDIAVMMDADNTMEPDLIPSMLRAMEHSDIVIASRFAGGSERGVSAFRRLCSRGARLFMNLLLRVPNVKDYTCGYRTYRIRLLRRLGTDYPSLLDSDGFTATVELLVRLASYRPRITEVPLDLRYDAKEGQSKMRVARTVAQYFWLATRIRNQRKRAST